MPPQALLAKDSSRGIHLKVEPLFFPDWRPRKPLENILTRLGDSLFSVQDLLVLQDLESFSHNMGLSTEWVLPSEPSIVQIFAGESNLNPISTDTARSMHQERPFLQQDHDQSLSQLPVERDAVGKTSHKLLNRN